ncbi:bifunctional non-homologous end joining protein LigD [Bryocella elongata]|uniref:DNA ligase (ATP) n=1 Tax=Bryocella elongata TaxID=863522 RepID=A0A1H5SUW8_9BACT|nr:DNA ligase D [Bryocella elongata]SEF53607.1 bifunctional non-homologous end joining protein LigD [Bryocella elongata]
MATSKKQAAGAAKKIATRKSAAKRPAKKGASKAQAEPRLRAAAKTPVTSKVSSKSNSKVSSPVSTRSKPERSADLVDEQLARYRSMRDFSITSEPAGSGRQASSGKQAGPGTQAATKGTAARPATVKLKSKLSRGLPFVIQKHAASHLHYDFRLGWSGVLKSWAVAKGPSYFPGDKRLAVQVEDHPMEYGGFEGIIPEGQYGGGTVMVWDQGTWWPQLGHENVEAGLREGSLKFEMNGGKMKGKWTLVRMKPHTGANGKSWGSADKPNWLLIKEHDQFEQPEGAKPITESKPNSALTGRTLEEIALAEDHVWNSKDTAKGEGRAWYRQGANSSTAALRTPATRTVAARTTPTPAPARSTISAHKRPVRKAVAGSLGAALARLPKERQPQFLTPQLALEATNPPEGDGWLHELKLDGYRIQARKHGDKVELLTRKGLDWTHRMPAIAAAVAALPVDACTLDGEVVVLSANGTTSFADLQAAFQEHAKHDLTYFVFDLLHLDGHNPRGLPLRERKALLEQVLTPKDETVRYSEHLETGGAKMFAKACSLQAEGIVSKRADSPYAGSRSNTWLKSKCRREQELVIGGYTLSAEGNDRIGALVLGYYDNGELIYAGRTGTGFTQVTRRDLLTKLEHITRRSPAFDRIPADARRDVQWVEPKLVAEVHFATWTADKLVRQASFLGLREDKPANEVRLEEPAVKGDGKPANRRSSHRRAESAAHHSGRDVAARVAAKRNLKSRASGAAAAPASIRLTHPEKVLDPDSGLTKRQLADYYWAYASHILPQITGRPLSLVRCPEGVGGETFFQKHANHMLPAGVGSIQVPNKKTGEKEAYIAIDNAEALTSLAQIGVLEIHPWGSTSRDLEHPDRIIFDLDPDESLPWSALTEAASDVRARLKKAGLESFLKLTGGKGLHVVAPIEPKLGWAEVKDATHRLVLAMERARPELYLTKMSKSERKGRIFLDYLRNERGATAVAAFSPRARPGVHVSLPLPWDALKETRRPEVSVQELLSSHDMSRADPWKCISTIKQSLDPSRFAEK